MLNLNRISDSIKELLNSVSQDVRTLPNTPNVVGIINESDINFIISSGERTDRSFVLTLQVMLATDNRTKNGDDGKQDMNTLIDAVILMLDRAQIIGCKPLEFVRFELFSPDAGKWRSQLLFDVPIIVFPSHKNGAIGNVYFDAENSDTILFG